MQIYSTALAALVHLAPSGTTTTTTTTTSNLHNLEYN